MPEHASTAPYGLGFTAGAGGDAHEKFLSGYAQDEYDRGYEDGMDTRTLESDVVAANEAEGDLVDQFVAFQQRGDWYDGSRESVSARIAAARQWRGRFQAVLASSEDEYELNYYPTLVDATTQEEDHLVGMIADLDGREAASYYEDADNLVQDVVTRHTDEGLHDIGEDDGSAMYQAAAAVVGESRGYDWDKFASIGAQQWVIDTPQALLAEPELRYQAALEYAFDKTASIADPQRRTQVVEAFMLTAVPAEAPEVIRNKAVGDGPPPDPDAPINDEAAAVLGDPDAPPADGPGSGPPEGAEPGPGDGPAGEMDPLSEAPPEPAAPSTPDATFTDAVDEVTEALESVQDVGEKLRELIGASKTAGTVNVDGRTYDWDYEFDQDYATGEGSPAVSLFIFDENGDVIDQMDGIELGSLGVSDHGNVNLGPEDEQYLQMTAEEMLTGTKTSARLAADLRWTDEGNGFWTAEIDEGHIEATVSEDGSFEASVYMEGDEDEPYQAEYWTGSVRPGEPAPDAIERAQSESRGRGASKTADGPGDLYDQNSDDGFEDDPEEVRLFSNIVADVLHYMELTGDKITTVDSGHLPTTLLALWENIEMETPESAEKFDEMNTPNQDVPRGSTSSVHDRLKQMIAGEFDYPEPPTSDFETGYEVGLEFGLDGGQVPEVDGSDYSTGFSAGVARAASLKRADEIGQPPSEPYEAWTAKVNEIVQATMQRSVEDLPDAPLADWHRGGVEPTMAAKWAMQMAGYHASHLPWHDWIRQGAVDFYNTMPEDFEEVMRSTPTTTVEQLSGVYDQELGGEPRETAMAVASHIYEFRQAAVNHQGVDELQSELNQWRNRLAICTDSGDSTGETEALGKIQELQGALQRMQGSKEAKRRWFRRSK